MSFGCMHLAAADTRAAGSAVLGIEYYLSDLQQSLGLPQDQPANYLRSNVPFYTPAFDTQPSALASLQNNPLNTLNRSSALSVSGVVVPTIVGNGWNRVVQIWKKHPMPIALVTGIVILLAGLTWFGDGASKALALRLNACSMRYPMRSPFLIRRVS